MKKWSNRPYNDTRSEYSKKRYDDVAVYVRYAPSIREYRHDVGALLAEIERLKTPICETYCPCCGQIWKKTKHNKNR